MKIERFEFDDRDDPESSIYPENGIRFTIAPEGMVIALPNGSKLSAEDRVVMGQILRVAYDQGKRVGMRVAADLAENLLEKHDDTPPV